MNSVAMELRSLHSPAVTTIPSSLSPSAFTEKHFLCGHGRALKLPCSVKHPDAGKPFLLQIRGPAKVSSVAVESIPNKVDKDENLVFVAGATGRVGSRTVRELLKLGFQVRAAVRSAQRAKSLVQSVQEMKLDVGTSGEGTPSVERLDIVECDLEKRDQIGPALGTASVVICCIGASEKEVFDITGPYRIDYLATKNLIDAATVAKVSHFILLTSLGTNKIGFPAAILNLFWGVLIWKRKAEEALVASGLPYSIVRPGGMERPTDAYKETHNITLSKEDTLFGGQVSNLQVAELMAFMAKNRRLSYCKVVEVVAESTVPLTPMEELLTRIPSQRADIYSTKESDAAGLADPTPKSVIPEAPSTPFEKKPVQAKAVASMPLSPYIAYEDLKPPTSPSPTPSGPKELNFNASTLVKGVSPSTGGNDVAKINAARIVEGGPPQDLNFNHSPYYVYDDLKPPTSPSPNVPTVTLPATASNFEAVIPGNSAAQSLRVDKVPDKQHRAALKPKPLSPFTMYEDLKPPTSPTPRKP
ncbi:protein TIC 62, chloroplastic isoform X2 [Malania oleifera]|uniref:protein TIC 62, chloroplastic isoform X2 n=1 Tax=Malania oleifera TaxID=397392 RepID=UPI0025AE9305|nr:protein TIC 62, chloroplastic isoform X2 [Malania oleifera]